MGTSFEDARCRGIVWARVFFDYIWAFLIHAPLSTDVPVLLLNQPSLNGSCPFEGAQRTTSTGASSENAAFTGIISLASQL